MAPQSGKLPLVRLTRRSAKGPRFIPQGNQGLIEGLTFVRIKHWPKSWCGWRRYRYDVGGQISGCLEAGDGGGGGGVLWDWSVGLLWEGGGCTPRAHQPSPQHTGSEAEVVVSES